MHGTINRGLQAYVCEIFGKEVWEDTCGRAELGSYNFETMLTYDDEITDRVLDGLTKVLGRERADLLEDFGTFVVSESTLQSVRKLLRFGGENDVEFLQSLEDVHDRAKIALPDLDVPEFELDTKSETDFVLNYRFEKLGLGAVFLGLLRGMADDYGALILIDHTPKRSGDMDVDQFEISLLHMGWPEVAQETLAVS
jgi:hypothetical protein